MWWYKGLPLRWNRLKCNITNISIWHHLRPIVKLYWKKIYSFCHFLHHIILLGLFLNKFILTLTDLVITHNVVKDITKRMAGTKVAIISSRNVSSRSNRATTIYGLF